MATITEMLQVATAKTEARKPWAEACGVLVAALNEAATNLSQAAETLRRRGLEDKARLYDGDAATARAAILRARNIIDPQTAA